MAISVVLVDDYFLVREGIIRIVSDFHDIKITNSFSNGAELLDWLHRAETGSPDIILMDTQMRVMSGRETFERVRKKRPRQKIVLLTEHYTDDHISEFMSLKANGFLSKNAKPETVVETLKRIHAYGFCSDPILAMAMRRTGAPKGELTSLPPNGYRLTAHRIRVLACMLRGLTSRAIAAELFISEKAAERVRAEIWSLTDCERNNYPALMEFAFRNGLAVF